MQKKKGMTGEAGPKPSDGGAEPIDPPLKMEVREEIPTQDTGPRLQCTYTVGKKGTTEDRPVESFAGKGE